VRSVTPAQSSCIYNRCRWFQWIYRIETIQWISQIENFLNQNRGSFRIRAIRSAFGCAMISSLTDFTIKEFGFGNARRSSPTTTDSDPLRWVPIKNSSLAFLILSALIFKLDANSLLRGSSSTMGESASSVTTPFLLEGNRNEPEENFTDFLSIIGDELLARSLKETVGMSFEELSLSSSTIIGIFTLRISADEKSFADSLSSGKPMLLWLQTLFSSSSRPHWFTSSSDDSIFSSSSAIITPTASESLTGEKIFLIVGTKTLGAFI
ncbi:unnamed protein product, partial [Nesidiocoris tenuis]